MSLGDNTFVLWILQTQLVVNQSEETWRIKLNRVILDPQLKIAIIIEVINKDNAELHFGFIEGRQVI